MDSFLLFLLLLFIFFAKPVLCDPRATQAALICSSRSAPASQRQTFVSNFLATMDAVTPLIVRQRYAAVINGTGNNTVYTFGECMKDLSQNDCSLCFAQCKTQILRCLPFQRAIRGGRLFFDGCYLRYDDYDFFNETLSSNDTTVCGKQDFGGNKTVFATDAVELVRNLSLQAVKNNGFFVGSMSRGNVSVFGLAQCWETLNGSACANCLSNAVSRVGSCTPKEEGRALNAGCYLRYSTHKFYNNTQPDPVPNNGGGSNKRAIIIETTTASACGFSADRCSLCFLCKDETSAEEERAEATRKFTNILLEQDCTAKIADFGLVILLPEDKTHLSTAVAGTLSYMAPEYVVRGKLMIVVV